MNNKITSKKIISLMILFCMIFLIGFVSAGDYKFQNKTPADLVVISGDTGNLTVTGNISTEKSGFFSYLGSLVDKITQLFVIDINFNGTINGTGNITTTGNITASNFFGNWNGSSLYVPYIGADSNVILGDNNFSVNSSTFFVDSSSGNVGIGTTTPSYELDLNGDFSIKTTSILVGGSGNVDIW